MSWPGAGRLSYVSEPLDARPLRGRRVTVMGLGLFGGGAGLVRFLVRQKARVTVTDLRGADELAPTLEGLSGLPVRWVLGEHRDRDFEEADVVFVNPAVPRDSRYLELAPRIDTEMNLFVRSCPGRIIGITGSNGKTTTTCLTAEIIRRAHPSTWVGGNLGRSLLTSLEDMTSEAIVVLELSSFQLEDLRGITQRPAVSVVTNLSPNHLDRHGTYAAYLEAKRTILEAGPPPNLAILPRGDAVAEGWATGLNRALMTFGEGGDVWVEKDSVHARLSGRARRLFATADLRLPGRFNLLNACAASAAAIASGIDIECIREAVRGFEAVAHRLEPVSTLDGVTFYNDSVSTTPESTAAGLEALSPGVVLILGGHDKGSDFSELARAVVARARAVVLYGKARTVIGRAIESARDSHRLPCEVAGGFDDVVDLAFRHARPGDKVVLSPACASYDAFLNFQERGERFRALVRRFATARA